MALDFPANPTNGQAYGSYIYNSTIGAWQSKEDPATVAVTSPTAPASANNGDIWYNTNTGVSYVYYADGSSAQWVEIVSSALPNLNTKANLSGATFTGNVSAPQLISTQTTGTAPMTVSSTTLVSNLNADLLDGQHASVYSPAGMVSQFAGAAAPTGWLLCDGASKLVADYPALHTAIGYTYGGSGLNFNLPNLKGKVPVGRDSSDTNFDNLNIPTVYAGTKTVALTESQLPGHTHTFSGTTSGESGHSHTAYGISTPTGSGSGYLGLQSDSNLVWYRGNGTNWNSGGGAGGSIPAINVGGNMSTSTSGSTGHTHTYSGTTSTGSGSGTAHNNLQPYIVMNYIIKV